MSLGHIIRCKDQYVQDVSWTSEGPGKTYMSCASTPKAELTSSNHVLVFESIFMCSFRCRVVIHPDLTVVAPVHGIGLPKLQQRVA